jgi:hypothetical protein
MLERARGDIGVVETTPNGGPRVDEMLKNVGLGTGYNWCAAAVSTWIFEAASILGMAKPIQGSGLAKAVMAQLQDTKNSRVGWIDAVALRQAPTSVKPGMIAVWNRGAPGSGLGHIAVVERGLDQAGTFGTIDGNSGTGSDRVQRNTRQINDPALLGMGYIAEPVSIAGLGYLVDPPGPKDMFFT